jgi:branched-chain amino acid transport system substrate-binding protein
MTGDAANDGQSELVGYKQAISDINAGGGVHGEKIVAKIYDNACDPKQAVAVAGKVVSDNIRYVLNTSCSAATLAAMKVYAEEGVVGINTYSSNPNVTDEGYFANFRDIYRDDDLAAVIAAHVVKRDAHKKITIIHDKSTFGQAIAGYFKSAINKAGVKEIAFEPYDPVNHDYSVLATHLKDIGTEDLFIGGMPVEAGLIAKQLQSAGSRVQIYGGYIASNDFWRVAGAAGEGALLAFSRDARTLPAVIDVVQRIQNAGAQVDSITLLAYAGAQVLAQALTKANSQNPRAVAEAIHSTTFNTILGAWTFDDKGDVKGLQNVMYRWHDGVYTELKE